MKKEIREYIRMAEQEGLAVVRVEKQGKSKHGKIWLSNGKEERYFTLSASPSDARGMKIARCRFRRFFRGEPIRS